MWCTFRQMVEGEGGDPRVIIIREMGLLGRRTGERVWQQHWQYRCGDGQEDVWVDWVELSMKADVQMGTMLGQ